MELFKQHRSLFQQQRSYCQEPDCIWQKGLAEVERRCSCSSKITQCRYKVSRDRTPNFHSLHFTFHPAALPRCNQRRAQPGPRPQPENNYTLLNILLKSKCVCWRCGSKQKNKCLIKKFTGKGQVTWTLNMHVIPKEGFGFFHPHVFPPLPQPKNQRRCKTRSMHVAKYSRCVFCMWMCATWYKRFNILSSSAGQQALQLHSHTVRVLDINSLYSVFSHGKIGKLASWKNWHQRYFTVACRAKKELEKKNLFPLYHLCRNYFSPH